MAGDEGGPDQLRHDAAEEIDLCEVDLFRIGALFGAAVDAHTTNWFALGNDLLSDDSSPKNWIQNGIASWIRCYETQVDLYRGICDVACHSTPSGKQLFNGMRGRNAFFTVDAHADCTDPIATPIPPAEIGNVKVATGTRLAPHIRLTLSDDGAGNWVVVAGLVGLEAAPDPLPPGKRRVTTLQWPGGSMKVFARRLLASAS